MAYESEVRRRARVLSDSSRNMRNQRNKIRSLVDDVNRWWKGKGGEAFVKEYQDIDGEAVTFMNDIDGAIDGLNRLPALIQRAERERREEEKRKIK